MSDLNVPEQLYQYMVGGHRRFQAGMHREKHKSPSYQIKVCVDFCMFKLKTAVVGSLRGLCLPQVTLKVYITTGFAALKACVVFS